MSFDIETIISSALMAGLLIWNAVLVYKLLRKPSVEIGAVDRTVRRPQLENDRVANDISRQAETGDAAHSQHCIRSDGSDHRGENRRRGDLATREVGSRASMVRGR